MKFNSLKILALILSLFLLTLPSKAQQTLGAITGTVTDPTGAAVPGATVKATNLATNLEVTAQSKSNGTYEIPQLPAGTYKMTFTKDGFKTETHTETETHARIESAHWSGKQRSETIGRVD